MKLSQLFKYIRFWMSTRSRLDIHSPFVYQIFSKVLQNSKEYDDYVSIESEYVDRNLKKYQRLIYRLAVYFHPQAYVSIAKEDDLVRKYLLAGCSTAQSVKIEDKDPNNLKLIFVDLAIVDDNIEKSIVSALQHLRDDSVLILWNLRRTSSELNRWNSFLNNKEVTISIDLFQVGLIFISKKLSREEFRLGF